MTDDATRTPSRWQGHRLSDPPAGHARMCRLLGVRIDPDGAEVARVREGLMRGDDVADAFVAWAAEQKPGKGRELFERAVEGGLRAVPDAPESLVRWFEPLEREPEWLDHDALRLGCDTAWRAGPAGGDILSAMALMGGYRSSAAVKPLSMTGALDRMVVRRIAETSRFVMDVYQSPSMGRFSAGFRSACRVRLMHTMVRRSLACRADWDERAWGVPINQSDMAGTHLEFSAIFITGLTALGFRFTPAERDAVMHLWRYVSVIMGVDDALLAPDYPAGLRHMVIHALTNPHADEDSRALARALHEMPLRLAETPLERALARVHTRYQTAVSRLTLGNEAVDDIGLPKAPLYPALLALSSARFAVETVRQHVPALHERAIRHGRALQLRSVADLIGDERLKYIPYGERHGAPAHRRPNTGAASAA
ncbi:MAG: DUF2236 domain-containing protein [Myxococcales bacterium]|nr:DUF2236 domain-containing protein [Myxococcales bacterium]